MLLIKSRPNIEIHNDAFVEVLELQGHLSARFAGQ